MSNDSSMRYLRSGKPYQVLDAWESYQLQQQAKSRERRIEVAPMEDRDDKFPVVFDELSCGQEGKGSRMTTIIKGEFHDGFTDQSRSIRLTYNARLTSFTAVIGA